MNTGQRNYNYEYDGQRYTLNGLCAHFGVKTARVRYNMVNKGMSVGEAIEECMKKPSAWGNTKCDTKKVMEGRTENGCL